MRKYEFEGHTASCGDASMGVVVMVVVLVECVSANCKSEMVTAVVMVMECVNAAGTSSERNTSTCRNARVVVLMVTICVKGEGVTLTGVPRPAGMRWWWWWWW